MKFYQQLCNKMSNFRIKCLNFCLKFYRFFSSLKKYKLNYTKNTTTKMNAFSLVSAVLLVNLLTIGFYASAQEAAKTKCYQCDELSDAGCKDPFNNNEGFIKDCENGETFCRKTVQFGLFPSY